MNQKLLSQRKERANKLIKYLTEIVTVKSAHFSELNNFGMILMNEGEIEVPRIVCNYLEQFDFTISGVMIEKHGHKHHILVKFSDRFGLGN